MPDTAGRAGHRAAWGLGAAQCVYWGLLYYGFSVLLLPMQRALELPRAALASAFSLGLLLAALAAPRIGRWLDAGHAAAVFRAGAVFAVAGLLVLAGADGGACLLAGWLLLGCAMSALLYEPAFGVVIRAFEDAGERLRALAAVTVLGGLASTLCLPLMAWVIAGAGWRTALACFALVVAAMAWFVDRRVLPRLPPVRAVAVGTDPAAGQSPDAGTQLLFATGTLAAAALTTLLVPLLHDRGHAPVLAASALAGLGLSQIPGRLWLLRGGGEAPLPLMVVWPLPLQAAGLALVAAWPGLVAAATGVGLFGLGAGLHTLARPWLVQALAGPQRAARWNGEVARLQGIARALGPALAAGLSAAFGTPAVFAVLAVCLLAMLPLSHGLVRRARPV